MRGEDRSTDPTNVGQPNAVVRDVRLHVFLHRGSAAWVTSGGQFTADPVGYLGSGHSEILRYRRTADPLDHGENGLRPVLIEVCISAVLRVRGPERPLLRLDDSGHNVRQ